MMPLLYEWKLHKNPDDSWFCCWKLLEPDPVSPDYLAAAFLIKVYLNLS